MIITLNGTSYRVEGLQEVPPKDGIFHLTADMIHQIRKKGWASSGPYYVVPVLEGGRWPPPTIPIKPI